MAAPSTAAASALAPNPLTPAAGAAPAPITPPRASDSAGRGQLPTPPYTRPSKILTLKFESTDGVDKYRQMIKTVQGRRFWKRAPKAAAKTAAYTGYHTLTAPKEAFAIAINPFYRGPELDGDYYNWLNDKFYDGEMPDIVRRVNKFRGFPQMDDPRCNPSAEGWREYYATEEKRQELQRYRPYLEAYWETNGDDHEEHTDILDEYHRNAEHRDYRRVMRGISDEHIMSVTARKVHDITTPIMLNGRTQHPWQMECHVLEWDRFKDDPIYARLRWNIQGQEQYSSGSSSLASDDSQPSSAVVGVTGIYLPPDRDIGDVPSPGIVHYHQPANPEGEDAGAAEPPSPAETMIKVETPDIPMSSIPKYHSPAGELMLPNHLPEEGFDEIRARTNIDALAAAIIKDDPRRYSESTPERENGNVFEENGSNHHEAPVSPSYSPAPLEYDHNVQYEASGSPSYSPPPLEDYGKNQRRYIPDYSSRPSEIEGLLDSAILRIQGKSRPDEPFSPLQNPSLPSDITRSHAKQSPMHSAVLRGNASSANPFSPLRHASVRERPATPYPTDTKTTSRKRKRGSSASEAISPAYNRFNKKRRAGKKGRGKKRGSGSDEDYNPLHHDHGAVADDEAYEKLPSKMRSETRSTARGRARGGRGRGSKTTTRGGRAQSKTASVQSPAIDSAHNDEDDDNNSLLALGDDPHNDYDVAMEENDAGYEADKDAPGLRI